MWCGMDIKNGYVNLDRMPWKGVDIVHDIETYPYPFEDSTFDNIHCSMVLEHVRNLPDVLNEMMRISKNGWVLEIIVPYFSSPNLWGDMTHYRWFNTNTFSGFHPNSLKNKSCFILEEFRIHFLSNCGMFMKSVPINVIPDFLINLFPKIYERFFCFILPSSEIHFRIKISK